MEEAERQIREMSGWDDDAAEYLRQTLRAARLKQQRDNPKPWDLPGVAEQVARGYRVYDPSRLYARCMMVYGGLDPDKIDEMHYKTFFALAREAVISNREQEEQLRKARDDARYDRDDPGAIRGYAPVVDKWEGNLHRLSEVEGS